MPSRARVIRTAAFALLALLCVLGADHLPAAPQQAGATPVGALDWTRLRHHAREPGEWFTGGRDAGQTFYSPLADINRDNVGRLGFAWQYATVSTEGFETTPIVIDGVMFASGPRGVVYSLDAETGQERWVFRPDIDLGVMRKICCGPVNRGVAVWRGLVYAASLDGFLYALDADTGAVRWKVNTLTDSGRGYSVNGAPCIAGDTVVIGNAGADYDARGYVTAYDLKTGAQRWRFFTVPGDPKLGFESPALRMAAKTWSPDTPWQVGLGGTVWDGMAYDPDLHLVYFGTGNGIPEPAGVRSPRSGRNLFLTSIMAIDARNGRMAWYYQTTPRDSWDYDADQKLILADLQIDGRRRPVIMQANKNGFFYALDRRTGTLLSAQPFVRVTWASGVDPKTGDVQQTPQADFEGQPKLIFPSWWGGHNWQPMAYSPQTRLVYIPTLESPVIFRATQGAFKYERGAINYMMYGVLPVPGAQGVDSDEGAGLPPLETFLKDQPDARPRGFLRAWDPVGGKVAWEVETSGPWAGSAPALWNGGGVMATAGGLVFQGRATGELAVLDAATGRALAQVDTGSGMMAAPMTYTVRGHQYIAIMSGVGGSLGSSPPGSAAYRYGNAGRIIALRLDGGAVPLPPERSHASDEFAKPDVPRRGTSRTIEQGAALFVRNCSRCHMNSGEGRIPDLRRSSPEMHAQFSDILLEGTRAERGMGSFRGVLSPNDVEALHDYLTDLQWQTYERTHADPLRH